MFSLFSFWRYKSNHKYVITFPNVKNFYITELKFHLIFLQWNRDFHIILIIRLDLIFVTFGIVQFLDKYRKLPKLKMKSRAKYNFHIFLVAQLYLCLESKFEMLEEKKSHKQSFFCEFLKQTKDYAGLVLLFPLVLVVTLRRSKEIVLNSYFVIFPSESFVLVLVVVSALS